MLNTAGRKEHLMTEGNIAKQILFFAIPLILGNLLQQCYNTADSIIVGNMVGSNALAAVGSSTSIINMLISFSQGASAGAGVIISQYLGAGQKKYVQEAVHTAMAMAILLGLVLSVGGVLLSHPLLIWMRTPDEVLKDSTAYLRLYFAGTIFNVIYNMSSGILNAAGNSQRSLMYLAIASVTNIGLDLILVGGLQMGVSGAAVATDISQFVSSVLAVGYLVRTKGTYRLEFRRICLHRKMAVRIIQMGLPTAIQNTVISFSNVLVQSSVNLYGAAAMAGFGAYMKIDGFDILPVMSISMAATTFVGQNYGAGKLKRVKKGMYVTLAMGVGYTLITGALLLLFSDPLMQLFTTNAEAVAYGRLAMRYFCPFYFLLSIMHGLAGTIRGAGKSVPPMLILLLAMCLFRIAWIQIILPHFNSINGVFLLYPVSWSVGLVLMVLYAWRGKWLRDNKV